MVMDPVTKTMLTAASSNAPTEDSLDVWIKAHPSFHVVMPKQSSSKFYGIAPPKTKTIKMMEAKAISSQSHPEGRSGGKAGGPPERSEKEKRDIDERLSSYRNLQPKGMSASQLAEMVKDDGTIGGTEEEPSSSMTPVTPTTPRASSTSFKRTVSSYSTASSSGGRESDQNGKISKTIEVSSLSLFSWGLF